MTEPVTRERIEELRSDAVEALIDATGDVDPRSWHSAETAAKHCREALNALASAAIEALEQAEVAERTRDCRTCGNFVAGQMKCPTCELLGQASTAAQERGRSAMKVLALSEQWRKHSSYGDVYTDIAADEVAALAAKMERSDG